MNASENSPAERQSAGTDPSKGRDREAEERADGVVAPPRLVRWLDSHTDLVMLSCMAIVVGCFVVGVAMVVWVMLARANKLDQRDQNLKKCGCGSYYSEERYPSRQSPVLVVEPLDISLKVSDHESHLEVVESESANHRLVSSTLTIDIYVAEHTDKSFQFFRGSVKHASGIERNI